MNVLISGVWASNKGDRAIATYLVNKLRQEITVDKIYVSANDPALLRKYLPQSATVVNMGYMFQNKLSRGYSKLFGFPRLIKAVNNDRQLKLRMIANRDYVIALENVDLVILTGGHHITTMREHDAIYSMTYELGLINRSKKRYILWSQTIGPLQFEKQANKSFIANLLGQAERVYIRDDNSDLLLKKYFSSLENVYHSYDSVFGIKTFMHKELDTTIKEECIGLSIFYSNYKTEEEIEKYANQMAGICRTISKKGFELRFFPMETSEKEINIIKRIIKIANIELSTKIVNTNVETVAQLREMNKCRFYIGHKTHSVIISLMLGIPLIALCYHEKTYDFMRLFGVSDYAVMDRNFNQKWFDKTFESLMKNESIIRTQIENRGIEISEKVNKDFEEAIVNG